MKTLTLRSLPQWLANKPAGIDRGAAIMYGVVAMQCGEAMGHGVWADQRTLEIMTDLGNSKTKGVAGRWGHPGASENTMGKKVQVAKNFRVDGDKLRHDSHLWKPARRSAAFAQDPLEYLMDVAEGDPEGIGESVVINTEVRWALSDGREISTEQEESPSDVQWYKGRPVNATTPLPVMRPVSFHFVDFVSEGALTPNGLFSTESIFFSGHSSEYAQELFDLVDRWRAAYSVPLDALPVKVTDLMERYIKSRGDTHMARKQVKAAQQVTENELYELGKAEELDEEIDGDEFADEELNEEPENDGEVEAEATGDLLAQAEGLVEEFSRELEFNFVTVEQFNALATQVNRLSAQIDRLTALAVKNAEATSSLSRSLKRVEGEPVVTLPVPSTPQSFEPRYVHPEPKLENVAQPPAEKIAPETTDTPLAHRQRIAKIQQSRKALVRRPN